MTDMRVKFLKQVTVEFVEDPDDFLADNDITFYPNQIVEVKEVTETIRGYLDIILEKGVAVGVPKEGLTIL
jgi:hypothetical protein